MPKPDPQPDDFGAQPIRTGAPKSKRALSRINRTLTEVEISQSGVQKMIVQDLERIEEENKELRGFRESYYDAARAVAVFEAERKRSVAWEVLSSGCLALGSAAIGFTPSTWSSQPAGWEVLIFGAILLLVGIVARCFRL